MKYFQGLFQVGVLVLLVFSTPAQGNGEALWNWLYYEKDVLVTGSSYSYNKTEVRDNVQHVEQTVKTEAAIIKNTTNLKLYPSGKLGEGFVINESLQTTTNYLPWSPNQAMCMTMDHEKWGDWFITSPLTGCDVWLAARKGAEPLAIHISAKKYGIKKLLKNLEYKENLAMQALNYFNSIVQGEKYHFVLRASYDFGNYNATNDTQKDQIHEYWNSFKKKNPDVVPIFYLGLGFFYGRYNILTTLEQWQFALKDLIEGRVYELIDYSVPKGCCNC